MIFALESGTARLLHLVWCGKPTLTGITSYPSVLGAKGRFPFTALATPQPPKRTLGRHACTLATFLWHLFLAFCPLQVQSNVHGPPFSGGSAKRQLAYSARSHNTIGQPPHLHSDTLTATHVFTHMSFIHRTTYEVVGPPRERLHQSESGAGSQA